MRRTLVFAAVLVMTAAITPAAIAKGPTVLITGGGTSENAGLGADTIRTIGFNAQEDSDGTFKGQVQVKNVSTLNGETLNQLHGKVVCIAPTNGVVAGGEGWEIRFQITKAKGGFLTPKVDQYTSVYVQDLDGGDFIDDVDSLATRGNELCGLNDDLVVWDSVIHGNITVRS